MNKSLLGASLVALALAAPFAHAHEAGDIILRAGAITVNPEADSSSVKVDQGPLSGADLGGKATMSSDTQLGLNVAYMITNNWGIELLAATPFEHDVKLKGTALGAANGKLGTLKHLPPTLSIVYYPLDAKSDFQPYLGAGINYTWIYDEHVGSEAQANGFSNFKAENSWGMAFQVGADYMLTDNVMINAQVRYIDIDTRATVENDAVAPGTRARGERGCRSVHLHGRSGLQVLSIHVVVDSVAPLPIWTGTISNKKRRLYRRLFLIVPATAPARRSTASARAPGSAPADAGCWPANDECHLSAPGRSSPVAACQPRLQGPPASA